MNLKKTLFFICSAMLLILVLSSWGFYAHQHINRLAVFTLPTGLSRFYKSNIEYITKHAVDADKRRYADTAEAARHYLDADHYGLHPFDSIPPKWKDAEKKYTAEKLNAYGILPWQIERTYYRLVKAFEEKDSLKILKASADLGHYVGDAHVPLHTTENYNGQLTGQHGIHAFWESRLPELFSSDYDYWTGRAQYIENPLNEAWKIVRKSFSYKDSVLKIEARVSKSFPADRKYSFSPRNGKLEKQYSEEFSEAFHIALDGMVEKQMRASILSVGSFWYSAWIDAGQPDLKKLIKKEELEAERQQSKKEEALYLKGKIIGREE
jgi:hypothetical protein